MKLVSEYVGTRTKMLCYSHYQALVKNNKISPHSKKIAKSEKYDCLIQLSKR